MRWVILTAFFLWIFSGCTPGKGEDKTEPAIPQLAVVVYDISMSTNSFDWLKPEHFDSLYKDIAYKGGGKIYGLLIKTHSDRQDPVIATIPAFDTLAITGNPYQRQNRLARNRQLKTVFEEEDLAFVQSFSGKMLLPKTEKFSDIHNALELAAQILSSPEYKKWNKVLLLVTDMENDLAPKNGIDAMAPVILNPHVNVAIVRPSGKILITKMLPEIKYTNFVSVEDAIHFLYNSN